MHQGSGNINDRHSLVWGLDQPFNLSGTRIKKDSVSLSGFTAFVWIKGRFVYKIFGPKSHNTEQIYRMQENEKKRLY